MPENTEKNRPLRWGARRNRTTRPSVIWADRAANWGIRLGGISVTVMFAAIVLFLGWTTLPLFKGPSIDKTGNVKIAPVSDIAGLGLDEELSMLWTVDAMSNMTVSNVKTGDVISKAKLAEFPITAFCVNQNDVAFGGEKGAVRMGRIREDAQYWDEMQLDPERTVVKTPAGQYRASKMVGEMTDPIVVGDKTIKLLDYQRDEGVRRLAAIDEAGKLTLTIVTSRKNMMTGAERLSTETHDLPRSSRRSDMPLVVALGLNGRGLYLIHADGWMVRYVLDDLEKPIIAEECPLIYSGKITTAKMLLGQTTLIVGDSTGKIGGWFAAPGRENPGADGLKMVLAHEFQMRGAVADIALSSRDRQFLALSAAGDLALCHMTSGVMEKVISAPQAVKCALSPKINGLVAMDAKSDLSVYSLDNPYADGNLSQLFGKLHYEGYPKPAYVYQSSAGTQDAEMKLSLIPLIFGTFKATLYAMLFAAPLAILAAIHTSEFMSPGIRSFVKPTIELMASLPSVVLGFIGALVLAPMVEHSAFQTLMFFVAIPAGLVMMGMGWQLLPPRTTLACPAWLKFVLMTLGTVIAAWVSWIAAPAIEWAIFKVVGKSPSFKDWLANSPGSDGTPGWAIILLPLFAVGLTMGWNLWIRPRLSVYQNQHRRLALGIVELSRFIGIALVAVVLSLLIGKGCSVLFDPRGPVYGAYVQRNSFLVGLMMGFAIIPIIYTVSEDALNGVPATLRSASMGAGATPWQTALRVVLPVAMSGIFSACMIGFGRSAGETMIVLMLSGRTPILDFNPFNGLSALSANIATEMPEAAKGSTHYRVLFVSTMVLFVLTFAVNTAAEIVRARFRKRAYQL